MIKINRTSKLIDWLNRNVGLLVRFGSVGSVRSVRFGLVYGFVKSNIENLPARCASVCCGTTTFAAGGMTTGFGIGAGAGAGAPPII